MCREIISPKRGNQNAKCETVKLSKNESDWIPVGF